MPPHRSQVRRRATGHRAESHRVICPGDRQHLVVEQRCQAAHRRVDDLAHRLGDAGTHLLGADVIGQPRPLEDVVRTGQMTFELVEGLAHSDLRRRSPVGRSLPVALTDSVEEQAEHAEAPQVALDCGGVGERGGRHRHERRALGRSVAVCRRVRLPAAVFEVGPGGAGQVQQHLAVDPVVGVELGDVDCRSGPLDRADPRRCGRSAGPARVGHLVVETRDAEHGGVERVGRVRGGEELLIQSGEPRVPGHTQMPRSARITLPPTTARISSSLNPCCTSHPQMFEKFSVGFSSPST